MTADIAQIISQGYASGKTAAEIAEEVAREFDRDDTARSGGDEGYAGWHGGDTEAERCNRGIESLRSQLATAESNYLMFVQGHNEKLAMAIKALEEIRDFPYVGRQAEQARAGIASAVLKQIA